MAITEKAWILEFLRGEATDINNRLYMSVLEWSDETLENCHNYIQNTFPLAEPSAFVEHSFLLTGEIVDEAVLDPKIIDNLKKAKTRFEQFYGINAFVDLTRQSEWCKLGNHNLLRITRIIRSLRLFGLEDEAQEFYTGVLAAALNYPTNTRTLIYWSKAMYRGAWTTLKG